MIASNTLLVPSEVITALYPQQKPTAAIFWNLYCFFKRLIHSPTGLDCMSMTLGKRENHSDFFSTALDALGH